MKLKKRPGPTRAVEQVKKSKILYFSQENGIF
jgi:hypothetical protein